MMATIVAPLFHIIVFPGFLFLAFLGLLGQYVDRKLYARLQNRVGPPLLQPLADFVKLSAKQETLPEGADRRMFLVLPLVSLAATVTASFYIPLWSDRALFGFDGDLIVALYFLMIPTVSFFLAGHASTSLYAEIGAVRAITQLFAYEVPLFLAVLSPALLAGTWSISGIASFYSAHPLWWLFNVLGFGVGMIAVLGKLEKVPFDIPEAETEIVGGAFTEYSGRLLALFKMTVDVEAIVAASLLAAVFLPFGLGLPALLGFLVYLLKVLLVLVLLTLLRTIMARLRIDQMMAFCWKVLAPLAFLQIVVCLVLKGVLP
jgi:NADH-quinone oxidoreductase subunit H